MINFGNIFLLTWLKVTMKVLKINNGSPYAFYQIYQE
jgi:hypothetical protein